MKQQLLSLTLAFILLTENAPMGEAPPNDVLKVILPGNLLSLFREKKVSQKMWIKLKATKECLQLSTVQDSAQENNYMGAGMSMGLKWVCRTQQYIAFL